MRVIGKDIIDAACRKYADSRTQLQSWLAEAEDTKWNTPTDITNRFSRVSILDKDQVVFRIKGNRYRLLVRVHYKRSVVRIIKFGTHAEYDNWGL